MRESQSIRGVRILAVFALLMYSTAFSQAPDADHARLSHSERAEAKRVAAEIADTLWREEPNPAARGLAIEIWRLLSCLGNEEAKRRLYAIARTDTEDCFSASRALHQAGDERRVEDLLELAQDVRKPLSVRSEALMLANPFYDFGFIRMPPPIEQLCLEILSPIGHAAVSPTLVRWAVDSMSYRKCSAASREPLETFVRDLIVHSLRASDKNPQSNDACTALEGLVALEKIGDSRSTDLYEWVARQSPWTSVRVQAAIALADNGQPMRAVPALREAMNQPNASPRDRLTLAYALVRSKDEPSRSILLDGVNSPDKDLRALSYELLCLLGDSSFIEKAICDYENDEAVGLGLLGVDHGFSDEEPGRSLQIQYISRIANEGRNAETRANAWMALISLDKLSANQVRLAVPVLRETPARLPNAERPPDAEVYAWHEYLAKLMIVLRFGTPTQKTDAMNLVVQEYGELSQRHFVVVRLLGFTSHRGAQRFLYRRVIEPVAVLPNEIALERAYAAISYLILETGSRPRK